jgi:hypothetical protein
MPLQLRHATTGTSALPVKMYGTWSRATYWDACTSSIIYGPTSHIIEHKTRCFNNLEFLKAMCVLNLVTSKNWCRRMMMMMMMMMMHCKGIKNIITSVTLVTGQHAKTKLHKIHNVHPSMCIYITPWRRVLPEKQKRLKLLKKVPAFYGTRRFITAFTTARHLSLSWARLIQSMPPIQPLEDPF